MGMAPQIDFGVNVNTRCPVIYPEHYSAPRMVDLGEELERLGYDTVFVGDNYFSKPRLESTTTLAAIAGRTRRIKLATSALIAPLRNTVWLALGWSTIDLIANGRTILVACVGGGSAEAGGPEFTREFDVAGVPYAKRGAVLEEQIEVLRRRYKEARQAGLSIIESRLFAESDQDVGTLRKLVAKGCEPRTIARIVT